MVTISIVLYKHSIEEIKPLVCILHQSELVKQIYLIDNSPSSNIGFNDLPATYIFMGKNLGYGKAHNIAIQKSIEQHTKYHIVLNPDIFTNVTVIHYLFEFMESHQLVGLCMPNIVYPTFERQYLCKLLPRPYDLMFRRFIPTKSLKKRHDIKFELQNADYNKSFHAPSLSGCFMFMRTDILKEVGGFDERFFMYCEDIDLCRRINEHSKTMYVPTIPVIHHYNKESYRSTKVLFYHIKSAIQYFNKWGWIFDSERKRINTETLKQIQKQNLFALK
jgi:GT2 family glycosyltransferase